MLNIPLIHQAIDEFILTNPTESYKVHIEKDDRQRPYLGLSQIGHECSRYLWYQFRHCFKPSFPPRILRLFRSGDIYEYRFIFLLRSIGCEIFEVGDDNKQFSVEDWGGHVRGNTDGVAIFPDKFWLDGTTPHPVLLEFKTASDKKFNEVVKVGCEQWNACYYGQQISYCGYLDLKASFFAVVNKNDESLYFEHIPFKKTRFENYVQKAGDIVGAQSPPDRMPNASASWFSCKWCAANGLCFGGESSQRMCRTCRFAEPAEDKQWKCLKGRAYGEVCELYSDIAKSNG